MKFMQSVVMMSLIATVSGVSAAATLKPDLPCQNQTKGQFNKPNRDASATADAVLNKPKAAAKRDPKTAS